jgi:hypothetical protein
MSWSGCPFCKKAKALLSELGAQYTALELDTMGAEGKALRAELAKVRAARAAKRGAACCCAGRRRPARGIQWHCTPS